MHDTPPPSSLPQSRHRDIKYRQARPLPVPLLDSCSIWIEEQLYSQAFSLFSSTLTSGTGTLLDAFIPPVQHVALAATLVVHPLLTTRTTASDKHVAADDALRYLRHINGLLGAQNGGLDKAFRFSDASSANRGKRGKIRVSDLGGDADESAGRLSSSYAGKESLWTNAEDFWCIVGWAFNCSVAHRQRWERWKVWLSYMMDVLQDDLENRLPEAEKIYATTQNTTAVAALLNNSILAQYLLPIGEGRSNKRRLMRAVLADGKQTSLAEFGEIWKNETKPPKQKADDRTVKRRKLDLENGEFGDYFDDSEDDSMTNSARQSRSTTAAPTSYPSRAASDDEDNDKETTKSTRTTITSPTAGIESLGGVESLHLRQRILALLSLFCSKNPDAFLDTEDLFDLYTEFLRPLPLPVFQQFVLPAKSWLGPNSQASLNQMLLRPVLLSTAPAYNENALTQTEFETYYAPFAANNTSSTDNAKVSLLIESLLRLLWSSKQLTVTPQLVRAVEQGIGARKEKAASDGRKKLGEKLKADEEALSEMQYSGERMKAILDMAR